MVGSKRTINDTSGFPTLFTGLTRVAVNPKARLDSWKEIAEYLGRDVRTLLRWEQQKGLPVHRVPGGKRQAVFAFAHEIDAWLVSQSEVHIQPSETREVRSLALGAGDGNLAASQMGNRESGTTQAAEAEESEPGVYHRPSLAPDRPVLVFPQPVEEVTATPAPPLPAAGAEADRLSRVVRWWVFTVAAALAGAVRLALWLRPTVSTPKVVSYVEISKGIAADLASGGIVTDGLHLYFNREQQGIVEVSAGGGETAPLPVPLRVAAVEDISPGHAEILLSTSVATGQEFPLWILPLPAGSPHRLGNVLAHGAAWSPDGRQIVFARGQSLEANCQCLPNAFAGRLPGLPNGLTVNASRTLLVFGSLILGAKTEVEHGSKTPG